MSGLKFEAAPETERISREFENAVHYCISIGRSLTSKRFENWAYHRPEHTDDVTNRVFFILSGLRSADQNLVSPREVLLGQLAAAFHDTVQDHQIVETSDGRIVMQRDVGENEKKSAREARGYMASMNMTDKKIFTEADIQTVEDAILTTTPSWSDEYKTVTQPKLTSESSIVARALALADLGVAGLDPYSATDEGDRVFREENIDIATAVQNSDKYTESQKNGFRVRMSVWADQQVEYFKGRKELFESEIDGLPERAKAVIRDMFYGFDETVRRQKEVAQRRREMPFKDIAFSMGYTFGSNPIQSEGI